MASLIATVTASPVRDSSSAAHPSRKLWGPPVAKVACTSDGVSHAANLGDGLLETPQKRAAVLATKQTEHLYEFAQHVKHWALSW